MYRAIPSSTPAMLQVAAMVANRVICVPIFPGLDESVLEKIKCLISH